MTDDNGDIRPVDAPATKPALRQRFIAALRFGLIGILHNFISYLLILIAVHAGLAPWQAFAMIFPLAVLFTYWLNSSWTFRDRRRSYAAPTVYAVVYVLAYGLTLIVSYALEMLEVADWMNAGLTILTVGSFTFFALDRIVFAATRQAALRDIP